MAEVTAMRNNALPYPVYGAPWTLVFPILDADGDLVTGATTPDAEVSKNGDTFTDCTNESTEIDTTSGMYYLTLTGTEMTADIVAVIAKSATSGAKTTPMVMYPRKLVTLRSGTSQGGAAGYITLDASAGAINDMWNGCLCVATIDGNVEARIITDYNGSNQQASVTPNWNVTPDADDTFVIYLPEGMQIPNVNTTHIAGTGQTARDIGASVLLSSGTGTGQVSLSSGAVTAGTVSDKTGYSLTATTGLGNQTANITGNLSGSVGSVTGAVGSVTGAVGSVGSGGITSASFATGAITATAIAADAIGASELAADAATEIGTAVWATAARTLTANTNLNDPTAAAIADAVWDEARSGHTGAGSFGQGVASVQGNVTGSTASIAAAGITSTSFDTGAITATAIATDAIGAAELATDAVTEIANAVAALVIEGSLTLQNAIKLVLAAAAGKVSGADGTTITIRDTTDTYNRIVATVDQYGNRSAVSYVTT